MGVYLGASVYNDSQVTEEWVHDEIEKNGKGVFFATYGVTTFNDILQEYNNGKIIVCKYEPETPGAVTTYYFNLVRFNTETFDFVGVMQDGTIYRTGVNVNEGWEQVANFKLDEIEFVEYNVDSYSTIKSHYDNGKFIVLKYRQQTPAVTKYYFYPLVSVDETNKEIIFGSLELGQNNKKVTFTVTDSGGWGAPFESPAVVVDSSLDSSSHNPVENMAIAAELVAINNKITGDLNDIFLALASKGVTVPAGAGLDDVAGLIDDIQTGGGEPIQNPDIKTYLYHEFIPGAYLYGSLNLGVTSDDDIEFSFMLNNDLLASDYSYGTELCGLLGDNSNAKTLSIGTAWNGPLMVYFGFYNGSKIYPGDLYRDTLYTVKIKKNETVFNGVSHASLNYSSTSLAYPRTSANAPVFKFYELKIFQGGKLKYRFIPAVYNGTSRGLYECLLGNFYQYDSNRNVVLGPEMPL